MVKSGPDFFLNSSLQKPFSFHRNSQNCKFCNKKTIFWGPDPILLFCSPIVCWDSKDRDNLSVLFISKEVLWSASLFIKRLCFLKAYSFCVWNDRKECCRHATALPAWYYVPKLELVKVWGVKSQPFCFSICNVHPILCFLLG